MTVKTAGEPAPPDEIAVAQELFRVEVRPSESGDLLVLAGEINLDAANRLGEAARNAAAGGREVSVDWREAAHVSAGALQVLLALRAAIEARGRRLCIAGDNSGVRRTLELAGLSGHFPLQGASG